LAEPGVIGRMDEGSGGAPAERAGAAAPWVKDGSDPATALDKKFNANNFFQADIPGDASGDGWQDRYFDPTRLASLERQFWVGGGPLPPRKAGTGPPFTSGLTPAETAFRAAKAALRKQQKGKAANGSDDEEEPAAKKTPAAKTKKPAKKKAAKKKAAKKKAAKKKAAKRKTATKRAKKPASKTRRKTTAKAAKHRKSRR